MRVRVRKNTGGEGDQHKVCWDPCVGREACLARVEARMKDIRLDARSMRGREGEHNRGHAELFGSRLRTARP